MLLDPAPIEAGDEQIDVEHVGHAAPCVGDFDGDGLKDLLIGEFYRGQMRIYRNYGTNSRPLFVDYVLFQDGAKSGCIAVNGIGVGFGPQLLDLSGDGHLDVISGNWFGQVVIFQGQADGTFAERTPVRGHDGKPLEMDYGLTAFACDWDDDGDLDLLGGSTTGNIFLVRNDGATSNAAFTEAVKLTANGEDIKVPGGDAGPAVADWDNDGRHDLIVGTGEGSVLLFRNIGSSQTPQLNASTVLVPPPAPDSERGKRAKICVTDWDEDGHLDLILGDFGSKFEKALSAEEAQWRQHAQTQQDELLESWAQAFRMYRGLIDQVPGADQKETHDQKLSKLRERLVQLNEARQSYYRKQQALAAGKQYHGRVWLLLRSPPGDPSRN